MFFGKTFQNSVTWHQKSKLSEFRNYKKKHFFDILGNLKNKTLIINMMKQSFDIRLILEGVNIETIISFILVAFI